MKKRTTLILLSMTLSIIFLLPPATAERITIEGTNGEPHWDEPPRGKPIKGKLGPHIDSTVAMTILLQAGFQGYFNGRCQIEDTLRPVVSEYLRIQGVPAKEAEDALGVYDEVFEDGQLQAKQANEGCTDEYRQSLKAQLRPLESPKQAAAEWAKAYNKTKMEKQTSKSQARPKLSLSPSNKPIRLTTVPAKKPTSKPQELTVVNQVRSRRISPVLEE